MTASTAIIITTAGSQEEATRLAHAVVEARLAACVNIIPQVRSIYRWQGKVDDATEWLLLIKSTAANFSRIKETIQALHSYELPECILVEIKEGSEKYLNWIVENSQ